MGKFLLACPYASLVPCLPPIQKANRAVLDGRPWLAFGGQVGLCGPRTPNSMGADKERFYSESGNVWYSVPASGVRWGRPHSAPMVA